MRSVGNRPCSLSWVVIVRLFPSSRLDVYLSYTSVTKASSLAHDSLDSLSNYGLFASFRNINVLTG